MSRYRCRSFIVGQTIEANTIDDLGDKCLAVCIEHGYWQYRFDVHGDPGFIEVRPVKGPRMKKRTRVVDRVTFPSGNRRKRRLCADTKRWREGQGISPGERSERKRAGEVNRAVFA